MKCVPISFKGLPGFILAAVLLSTFTGCSQEGISKQQTYDATWQSLTSHQVPDWLRDAKFGIYAHWGLYSVPAHGNEWYAKLMYNQSDPRSVYKHHIKTYGDPSEFGYKDFIPMFKAEKFNPDEWADIIKRSGAKYAGIALVHHDGFGLWDSDINKYNVGKMGPKRDLYGDLVKSLRKEDLKIIATFHHIRTFDWYLPKDPEELEQAIAQGWDLFDPEYAELYWNRYTGNFEDFIAQWKAKVKEVADKYKPDVVWFDGGKFQTEESSAFVRDILAYYYNKGDQWGKEVEILNKLPSTMVWNFPRDFGVLTYEGGRDRPELVDRPWIDDLKIGNESWGYIEGLTYRKANHLIDGLVDRTARNGGLLLSLSPKADGTLPQGQIDLLLDMGNWLELNGEAIFGTRPWKIQSEGDIKKFIRTKNGIHPIWIFDNCTAEDIRFTTKDGILYAIALDWPKDRKITIKTLSSNTPVGTEGISSIKLLGSDAKLKWTRNKDSLTVHLPRQKPCDHAFVLKIQPKGSLL